MLLLLIRPDLSYIVYHEEILNSDKFLLLQVFDLSSSLPNIHRIEMVLGYKK